MIRCAKEITETNAVIVKDIRSKQTLEIRNAERCINAAALSPAVSALKCYRSQALFHE
jgi:hypothetical protein